MADNYTVLATLKLDDQASAALDKVKSGFSSVHASATKSLAGITDFAKQTASTALGMNLGNMFQGVASTFQDIIQAAKDEATATKKIAGILMMTGKAGESWASLTARAGEYKAELQDLAIKTGVVEDELVEAFEHMTARSAKPPEEIKKLISNMADAAKIVPGGVAAMTNGFQMFEMGMIRAKNPLVSLIKASGLMEGSAKEIAKSLMKMGPEGAMAMGEKAMSQMAEKSKAIPMSMGQMITSLKEMKGSIFETIGGPIFKAIVSSFRGPLESVRKFFKENKEGIEKIAIGLGDSVTGLMLKAGSGLEDTFHYIADNSEKIQAALVTGAQTLYNVLRFMVQHKEVLLALAAAHAVGNSSTAGAVGGLARSAMTSGQAMGSAAGMSAGTASVAGAAMGLAAFTAAIAAVGVAAYQASKLLEENNGHLSIGAGMADANATAIIEYFNTISKGEGLSKKWSAEEEDFYQERKNKLMKYMRDANATEGEIAQALEKINKNWAKHTENREQLAGLEAAQIDMEKASAAPNDGSAEIAMAVRIQNAYAWASSTQNQSAMAYIGSFIAGNIQVQNSLLNAGPQIGLAFDGLADVIGDKAGDFASRLRDEGAKIDPKHAPKPDKAQVNMNGGQTFNIKQEFKDDNADRVAIVFQRDMLRAALTPRQSRIRSL